MEIQSDDKNRRSSSGSRLRIKNKGGAPRGNRNAQKHGAFTRDRLAARKALRDEARKLLLQMNIAVARAMFATMGQKPRATVTRIELTPLPHRPNS